MEKLKALFKNKEQTLASVRWMRNYVKPYIWQILLSILVGITTSAVSLVMVTISKSIIDNATFGSPILRLIVIYIALIIAMQLLSILSTVIDTYIREYLTFGIRRKINEKIINSHWMEIKKYHSGDLMTRLTSDVQNISNGLVSTLPGIILLIVNLVMVFCTLFHYSHLLAVLALLIAPVAAFTSLWLGTKLSKIQKHVQESEMPLEWVESAITWLRKKGMNHFGLLGMSFGAIMSLTAAAYIPDIEKVFSLSGYDYVIEGTEGTGKTEVPSGHSGFTWRGEELPFQPYYLSGDEFKAMMAEQTKLHGEAYGRGIWEHSVQVQEPAPECYIPLENSHAEIWLFSDEPDTCWDTAAGSRRLQKRLKDAGYTYPVKLKVYKHGYHILLPDCVFMGKIAGMMFNEGKKYKKECKQTRVDIQRTIEAALKEW